MKPRSANGVREALDRLFGAAYAKMLTEKAESACRRDFYTVRDALRAGEQRPAEQEGAE